MQAIGRKPHRAPDGAPVHYERHRPEQTTLYRLVQKDAATWPRRTSLVLRMGTRALALPGSAWITQRGGQGARRRAGPPQWRSITGGKPDVSRVDRSGGISRGL